MTYLVDGDWVADYLKGRAEALALLRSLEEAGRMGSAAAALTTTKLGAQAALPDRAAVTALLANARQQ